MLGVIDRETQLKMGINQVSVLSWRCLEILTGVLTASTNPDNFKWAYRNKPKQGIYNNGFAMVPL
jgi:hypothetical protein